MRLGDLDALKEELKSYFSDGLLDSVSAKLAFNMILRKIDDSPTIPRGEWIPVSERLPKQANQDYLVTIDYGKAGVSACQRFFFGEGIGWNDTSVIAWQPLPEPYKRGGKE